MGKRGFVPGSGQGGAANKRGHKQEELYAKDVGASIALSRSSKKKVDIIHPNGKFGTYKFGAQLQFDLVSLSRFEDKGFLDYNGIRSCFIAYINAYPQQGKVSEKYAKYKANRIKVRGRIGKVARVLAPCLNTTSKIRYIWDQAIFKGYVDLLEIEESGTIYRFPRKRVLDLIEKLNIKISKPRGPWPGQTILFGNKQDLLKIEIRTGPANAGTLLFRLNNYKKLELIKYFISEMILDKIEYGLMTGKPIQVFR